MEDIKLTVEVRDGKGTKKDLSTLRAQARVPGVVYGGDKPPVRVALAERELLDARRRGGVNAILHLVMGKTEETVIVKDLQRHPVTERLVHADFQRISLTQKLEAKVPLRILGEAPGVKNSGGILQYELRELSIRALPKDIPQGIDVDVSRLEINQHILVRELPVPAGVEVLDAPEHMVVNVTTIKVVEEAPAAAAPAGEAAAAEPEVASTKGKKDEEGKLVKETAKGAAPAAEKGKESAKKEGEK
ncbi:MAG TPA: 50S ribosomal protein L25 [Elusimicrobia bacterium]|nr:50S ribosomal protein L25 [Elusimicrobiota bacterium]HBT61006.1 50S ribosomal protein L25 [Elusimicrobiota bacterium]